MDGYWWVVGASITPLLIAVFLWKWIPLRNRREGRITRIAEGMTEWRWGDRVGYGLAEYLDHLAE